MSKTIQHDALPAESREKPGTKTIYNRKSSAAESATKQVPKFAPKRERVKLPEILNKRNSEVPSAAPIQEAETASDRPSTVTNIEMTLF